MLNLHKQKRSHRLHKFLSWLLILVTVLSVFAGSSLSVSAEEPETYDYYFKASSYRMASSNKISFFWDLENTFGFPLALYLAGYTSNSYDSYDSSFNQAVVPRYFFCFYCTKSASNATNARLHFIGSYEKLKNGQALDSSTYYDDFWASPFPSFDLDGVYGTPLYFLDTNVPVFDDKEKMLTYLQTGDDSGRLNLSSPQPDEGDDEDDSWYKELLEKIKGWIGGMFEILVAPLELLANGITSLRDAMLDKLPLKIKNALYTLFHAQELLAEYTLGKISDLYDFQLGKAKEFLTFLKDIYDTLKFISVVAFSNLPQGIRDALEPFLTGFDTALGKMSDRINHLGNQFADWLPTFNEIRDRIRNSKVGEAVEYIKGDFSKFKDKFVLFYDAFTDFVAKYDNPAQLFRDVFAEGLKMALLPDADDIREKLDSISAKIDGIRDLQAGGLHILQFLQNAIGTSPPVITVNLGSAAGKYNLGNQTVTLDFSWYAPYKSMVDQLLGAFIWANFLWNIFKRLPDIINGAGMVASSASKIGKDLK